MNVITRKTRACTIDSLDEELKTAIRAHAIRYGLEDLESDLLMCCETITLHQKKGFLGGIRTMLSAVYVTRRWLVWADSSGPHDVAVDTLPLNQIDMHDYRTAAPYAIVPEQGLNITGYYTSRNMTKTAFIVLEAEADGQRFRQVLNQALRNAARPLSVQSAP